MCTIKVIHLHFLSKWSFLKQVIMLGLSVEMTHAGALNDDYNSTSRFHFSDITKDVVVATRIVCTYVCTTLYTSVVACATLKGALLAAYI